MKKSLYFFLFTLALSSMAVAQTSIISDINTPKAGQGNVIIYQDEAITGLIGKRTIASTYSTTPSTNGDLAPITTSDNNSPKSGNSGFIRTKGYKIQVYSGNDQKRSKNEAYSRKDQIAGSFSDMEVAITFNSPVWRARAGNFKTYEQAFQALTEMKKAFPSFGREMQIVEDVVKLSVE